LKTALITIGSTREYIDPVRYISNESSGKQGMSLIKGLLKKNYKIICLHGYLKVKPIISRKIKYIFTPNAKSMLQEAKKNHKVDIAIFNAAVSDFYVKSFSKNKIKSKKGLTLQLINNPDILKSICSSQKKPLITVGFAYETNNYLDNAKKKLENKKCDFIVLNYPLKNDFIFNNNFNNGGILDKQGNYYEIGNVSKTVFANKIIKHILEI
jgi:phosphopantothenoylcysteine decarboxylase/phosphopantothenate--cysteine ligase|tara:strand:- start:36 stop:668 length:633 start_codon:yes stop_codon:yes gene_type:complete